ncbi:MAG TPA: branched-chain amino acid ABC transporter permease [Xanthobacteraceae bacterium]|nr:branched-chain amino acid ABC transporter permease [Xanthobacteraceae bacterium]
MPSTATLLSQAFSGFAFGSLLALMSSGLTIIFGTLGFVNFAHGAMFMLGAYAAFVALVQWHSFVLALLVGAAVLLVVAIVLERGLLRFFYTRPPEDQLLVTFGLSVMIIEAVRFFFGSDSQRVSPPAWGNGIVNFFGEFYYPLYRVEVIGIAGSFLFALYVLLYHTSLGLTVRAGIEDRLMIGLLGIDVRRMFLIVFAVGAIAAGVAGVIFAPLSAVIPDMGTPFLVQAFVVVVIGGLGSFGGAIVGGLVVGELLSLTTAFDPAYSEASIYAVMALVLVLRPRGLFGAPGRV